MIRRWCLVAVLACAGCASVPPFNPPAPPAHAPDLWLGSNVQTADMPRMLSAAGKAEWPETFAALDVYQFHGVHLLPGCGGISCGPNTWARLRDEGVLDWLRHEGKGIGVEHAPLKEWDCDGQILLDQLRGIFARTAGRLTHVAMDWPFTAAHHANCQISHDQAAAVIARYMRVVTDRGAAPVLIEGYPHWPVPHFFEHLDAVTAAATAVGTRLSAVSLDINIAGGADSAAVRALVSGIRERGYRAGLILWGDDGSSARFAATARQKAALVLRGWLGCDVDYVLVQSWARVGTHEFQNNLKLWPNNLPEFNPNTLTGLARTEACQ